MKKVSETGIEKYTEEIGTGGTIMSIRVETTADGKYLNGQVKKNDKTVSTLSIENDGRIFMSVSSDANLTNEEFYDLFPKAAAIVGEILGIEAPGEENNETV